VSCNGGLFADATIAPQKTHDHRYRLDTG